MTTPLTGLQEAFWLGRNPSFELGNVGARRYLEADLADVDLDRLERAWNALVALHPALRMTITSDGKAQLTPEPAEYRIAVHDLRAMPEPEQQEQLDQIRNAMCGTIGDPTSWPLFEIRVSLLGGNRARLHVDLDLVTMDEDGIAELGRDLRRRYTGAVPTPELPELPAAPALPLATEPGMVNAPQFVRRERVLPRIALQELKELARGKGIGIEAVLAAAFSEVIANWSKEWSFTISIAKPDSRPGVGNPTSITPLAMDASLQRPFTERASEVQARLAAATTAYGADGVEAVRELNRTGRRLAPALPVVFMPRLSEGTPDIRDWALGSGSVGYELTRLPQVSLAHEVADIEGELRVAWHAVDALFPPGLLDHLVDGHLNLLSALAASSDRWDMPSPESVPQSQQAIRERTNDTAAELPDVMLHELFWAQAAKTPDAPAVIAEERTLTFREVRAGADALATQLIALGAKPNRMVAIVMEKGWEQPVAVMGILESGAAYVPIEPDLPEERFHYLLQHAEVELALVQPHLAESLPWPDGVRRIVVDDEVLRADGRPAPRRIQTQRDMAYVIYTSGSTGLPKGVMIDHRGALNTVLDINRRFGVGADDRVLALTPLSFDLSVYDLFGPFAVGGAIVMPSAGTARAPWHWAAMVEQHHVTLWNTVPALMEMLAGYAIGRRERIADSLRLVLMSGDWIAVTLPDRIRSLSGPEIEIVNLGGATEASIWSVYYRIGEVDPSWSSIPYGKPLANQSIEVLDGALRRRPDWVPGEQYIGGFGVAMGYWRDEEKTSRAFIKHPRTGARLYRTGDLGRYFPDGNVEFLGREDFQVKIHGYRIELGEIEAALLSHDLVTASVVTAIGSARGEKRLVAYVTVTAQPDQDRDALQLSITDYLAAKLPAHMVPGHLMILDQLPLTPNSKIDRKALPLPQLGRKGGQTGVEPELTVMESRLLAIWQEQLSEKIDVKEDPFELGADSIMAARVHRRISDELSAAIKLDDVLLARSVRALAAALAEN